MEKQEDFCFITCIHVYLSQKTKSLGILNFRHGDWRYEEKWEQNNNHWYTGSFHLNHLKINCLMICLSLKLGLEFRKRTNYSLINWKYYPLWTLGIAASVSNFLKSKGWGNSTYTVTSFFIWIFFPKDLSL